MKLSPEARSRRNVECWLASMGRITSPVIIDQPLNPRSDRCFLEWSLELQHFFDERMDRWFLAIRKHQPLGKKTATQGWRERRATWAAQVVEHHDAERRFRFFEIDFDDMNPDRGIAPLIGHAIQWLRGRFGYKTDPFAVARHRSWEGAQNG